MGRRDVLGLHRLLTGVDRDSIEMREVSPMSGLLSQDERTAGLSKPALRSGPDGADDARERRRKPVPRDDRPPRRGRRRPAVVRRAGPGQCSRGRSSEDGAATHSRHTAQRLPSTSRNWFSAVSSRLQMPQRATLSRASHRRKHDAADMSRTYAGRVGTGTRDGSDLRESQACQRS